MRENIEEMAKFYQGKIGINLCKIIDNNLKAAWPNLNSQDVLGYGCTIPFLVGHSDNTNHSVNYLPIEEIFQLDRRFENRNIVAGDEFNTPFKDASFDKILCVHGLEESNNPNGCLRELWRILAPEGEMIIIVPNRNSIWARIESTPFGHGRPFSKMQSMKMLNNSLFKIMEFKRIIFTPPWEFLTNPKATNSFEKIGKVLWPSFGGLNFIRVKKRVYIEPNIKGGAKIRKKLATSAL